MERRDPPEEVEAGHVTRAELLRRLLLGPRGLVFELQVCQCQLAEAADFVSRAPEVTFMLNHAGFPLRGEHAAWREGMRSLAAQPNVACKLGAFGA